MTPDQLRERFPNCSDAFVRANATHGNALDRAFRPEPMETPAPKPKQARIPRKAPSSHAPATSSHAADAYERAKADYSASLALVERDLWDGALATGEAQKGNSRKFLVSVTSFRVRLLDEDNLAEKYHVDLCRYYGLICGDDPSQARIVTTQEKVRSKDQERTEVTIEPIP